MKYCTAIRFFAYTYPSESQFFFHNKSYWMPFRSQAGFNRVHISDRGVFLIAYNHQNTPGNCSKINAPQSAINSLSTSSFIHMADQNHSTSAFLCHCCEVSHYLTHFLGALHITVRWDKSLNRIKNQHPRPCNLEHISDSSVIQCEVSFRVIDKSHSCAICTGLQKTRLYRVLHRVFVTLIDYRVRTTQFRPIREDSSICKNRRQAKYECRLSFSWITLKNCNLSTRDIRVPQPIHITPGYV